MDSSEQAIALRGLADAFEKIQGIDSNAAGFVIRIRVLQTRAAEIVLQALTARRLEGHPWTDRLWWLAKHHAEFAETIQPPDIRRVALLRNFWLEVCGFHIADLKSDGTEVAVLRVKGKPLFATPFESQELARLGLQADSAAFATEAARQARLRSGFICGAVADAISPPKKAAFAKAADAVPAGYTEGGRACGPLCGTKTAMARIVTANHKANPDALDQHHGKKVFIREISQRKLEVFFRTFKEFHAAEERLTPTNSG